MTHKTAASILVTGIMLSVSSLSMAGSCKSMEDKINQVFGPRAGDVCLDINTEPTLENNPYLYVSPDTQCDLGLQLPGLPDFGISLGGINACAIIQAVTGPMVDEVNKEMAQAVRDGVKVIDDMSEEAIGQGASGGIDANEAFKDLMKDQTGFTIPGA